MKTAPVRLVELLFGPRVADRAFWYIPLVKRNWYDVAQRVDNLRKRYPEDVPHFVALSLRRSSAPMVIAGLAQRPHTADQVAAWLSRQTERLDDDLVRRLGRNPLLAGAVLGASALLLGARAVEDHANLVIAATGTLDSKALDFAASLGYRPNSNRDVPAAAPARSTHRAVIAEELGDPDQYAVYFNGTDRVTVLATVETFGRFDPTPYLDWPGVGDVRVEHVRTRIPRYSAHYIDLHTATADLATRIVGSLGPLADLVDPSDLPVLTVEVADWLFFRALRLHAVERLLDDPEIDHVVVAIPDGPRASDFASLLGGSSRLRTEPRVEFVSASRSELDRARFIDRVDLLRNPPIPRQPPRRAEPAWVLQDARRAADRIANEMGAPEKGDGPRLLFVTTNNSAYNYSTAHYIKAVADHYDVRCVHVGRNATDLISHLQRVGGRAASTPLEFITAPPSTAAPALADALHAELFARVDALTREAPGDGSSSPEHSARWAASSGLGPLCRDLLAPAMLRLSAMNLWFSRLQTMERLPELVVITPQRAPATHAFAPLARRYQVPSLILEPHAQDANYSRYIKISSDYYGVMSEHYRSRTSDGFAMPVDRIHTVGTPRQIRPRTDELLKEQEQARSAWTIAVGSEPPEGGLTLAFFCQPSRWDHVCKVWSSILIAARECGAQVLLKPHPEESPSRVRQYVERARELNVHERVECLTWADAPTTIALSDIVVTAYSAAALDAAVRGKPVLIITDGDLAYPVDIPAIIDAPIVRSADELSAVLRDFATDPTPLLKRVQLFLEREPQFVTGPNARLNTLIRLAINRGSHGIRAGDELPGSLFLDPPHPTFPV